jgi:hypothetical protein
MFRTAPENQTTEIAVFRLVKYYKEACTTEEARRFRLEIESYIDKVKILKQNIIKANGLLILLL